MTKQSLNLLSFRRVAMHTEEQFRHASGLIFLDSENQPGSASAATTGQVRFFMSKPETVTLPKLTDVDEKWLDNYLQHIRELIVREAIALADENKRIRPEGLDVADAARRFAPGLKFPDDPSFADRIKGSLSGITLVSAVLAVIFGLLGVFLPNQQQSYFDIVKIFAGAVVGSTGVGFALSRRK